MGQGSLVEDAHPYGREDNEDGSLDEGLVGDHHTTCKSKPAYLIYSRASTGITSVCPSHKTIK